MLSYHNNQPDCLFCRICLFGAGPIPALKALTNLKNINLGENLWSGLVPDLSQLSKLQELNLHNAIGKTTQGFPDLSNCYALQTLDLQYAHIQDIPAYLAGLKNLTQMSLSFLPKTPPVPAAVQEMCKTSCRCVL